MQHITSLFFRRFGFPLLVVLAAMTLISPAARGASVGTPIPVVTGEVVDG